MVTFSLNQVLTAILLVSLIVLTIFLVFLVKNAIETVKKANSILDDGMSAVDNVKGKVNDVKKFIEKNKITALAESGLQLAKVAVKKAKERRG